jgi:hypothetical protein
MTENVKLLLKYEGKKKSYDNYIAVGVNLILLIFLITESIYNTPKIVTSNEFRKYMYFKLYQIFAIMLTALSMISTSCIRDIRNYRYLLGYPIKYQELFGFIKIRKLKNIIFTFIINLISLFFVGIQFNQNYRFFLVTFLGFFCIFLTCYLISDIVSFGLFCIFSSDFFIPSVFMVLCSPLMIVINSMKKGNIINFSAANKIFIQILDNIYPYCKFVNMLLFKNVGIQYTFFVLTISSINILLLLFLYEKLIKVTFFKVLEKEDRRKSELSKIDICAIRPQSSFRTSLLRESRFLIRENKKYVFNIQVLVIFGLAMFMGVISRLNGSIVKDISITSSAVSGVENSSTFIILIAFLASLLIDIINFTLHSGRFSLGMKYLSFEKYIQLNPEKSLYSIISLKSIIAFSYYILFFIIMYLYGILESSGIWASIICTVNLITVVGFDTFVDIKIPNLYQKMTLSNVLLEIIKPAAIIAFKAAHFFSLIFIEKYIVHNIFVSLFAINLLFFIIVILLLNSKNTLLSYHGMNCLEI